MAEQENPELTSSQVHTKTTNSLRATIDEKHRIYQKRSSTTRYKKATTMR